MKVTYLKSFDQSVLTYRKSFQNKIYERRDRFLDFLIQREIPKGMGLKKMKHDFWEIRVGLSERIIFRWRQDELIFVLVGNHGRIRQFLKGVS